MPSLPSYAELHCHTSFSFLDGASSADDLVARAVELGLTGLAVTEHHGLYGAVRFVAAAREAGIHPVVGIEVELLDAIVPDPHGIVVPARGRRGGARPIPPGAIAVVPGSGVVPGDGRGRGSADGPPGRATDGLPARPRAERPRLPGHREPVREDLRGVGERERGPHLVLLARDAVGYRSLCRLVSRANLAGTKGLPRFTQALLAAHAEGLVALSGCRDGEIARRLVVGDREGARAAAEAYARTFGASGASSGRAASGRTASGASSGRAPSGRVISGDSVASAGFALELQHHLLPDDDWLVAETARLAGELGLPVVVTNDVHYALPEDREMHDLLTAIRHGRSVAELGPLRRPDAESYLKSAADLLALPPGDRGTHEADPATARAWDEGIRAAAELAASCEAHLEFERYRFPGFDVPKGETPFSHLERLCHEGAVKRYHPMTPAVVTQLAHELDVIERTGLAEFFLICWDLMRFARERRIPAQGRGSAADSIVAYVLGITRVDPIRHRLLFERFINEGRTTYPDVDIDFSSERREEVIQYVYATYGPEHTGMVCNFVTYRARSAIREVGYALGFPRPLVDRVAKAVETFDSRMIRRDLETEGGFGYLFARPGEGARPGEIRAAARDTHAAARDTQAADGLAPAPAGGSRPSVRAGGPSDDEGGPGDTPVSVAWLRAEASTAQADASGRDAASEAAVDPGASASDPDPLARPRGGSTVGMSPWERWLEMCARIDGFPRHLSIHSGGMLVTAAPLIDIAPLERATMPGRVVVQYDKRDVETLKLIKLDLLGLGMLAAMDEALRLIEHDCAVCLDLDRLPEDVDEVFRMLQAADTVGVFQVESRAQMQTLPKSKPRNLDDLVVEVAIIRPGPIQGNAVHPYLRRKQGLEPVEYLHPKLEPILGDTLGVILYQEQVMQIAIAVGGFSAAESDGFRRAMGTWRSTKEMEKLHERFVTGCVRGSGMRPDDAEELFRRIAGFASFGFAKSHAAAFARTAYESAFLKLFYPAQLITGVINAQPMGFYPVEVLVNDVKRHGVAVLPVDVNASSFRTTTEWVGRPGWALARPGEAAGDGEPVGAREPAGAGEPLPDETGIARRPEPVRSSACVVPGPAARERWAAESAVGWGIRLGLHLVKGIGEEQGARVDEERARGPFTSLADIVARTELSEETVERLVRAGALDSLGRPRRELLWQLREVAGASKGRAHGAATGRTRGAATGRMGPRPMDTRAANVGQGGRPQRRAGPAAGRPMDLRLPPTPAPELPPLRETERLGDAYAILAVDPQRQVIELFRPALERLGAVSIGALADRRPGPVRIGGLVVTRQHPMTARGTVFLAIEDETGMANITLWPDTWARLRGTVRRHALLLVEGTLQRDGGVVNVVAHDAVPLGEAARRVGGPGQPVGVRRIGHAGMRRQ
jgi:error-prone DNA polymerase